MKHAVEHGYTNGRFGILTGRASCPQGGVDDTLVASHRRDSLAGMRDEAFKGLASSAMAFLIS
jgi:hypothetical protein